MLRVALKGLAGRTVRALLTAIAIILGVAMISGTYILTDTINSGFDTIFSQSYKNADIVITGKAAFDNANGNDGRGADAPGVAAAEGAGSCRTSRSPRARSTTDSLKLIGKDGKVIVERRRADARLLRRRRPGSRSTRPS